MEEDMVDHKWDGINGHTFRDAEDFSKTGAVFGLGQNGKSCQEIL